LGETAPTKKIKNTVDEYAFQSSGEDTLETSKSIDQIKERQNDGEDLTQDKDINGEPVTERGTAEASQTLIANDAKALQDVTEKDDTIKSGEDLESAIHIMAQCPLTQQLWIQIAAWMGITAQPLPLANHQKLKAWWTAMVNTWRNDTKEQEWRFIYTL
jgi:hypothetical protein